MSTFPFAPLLVGAVFLLAVGATVAGAVIAAFSRRIIRGVSGLMICCVGLAGLYAFLQSPFLALMEILIYVGAVCITIVFGIMLSEPDEPAGPEGDPTRWLWGAAAILAASLLFVMVARTSLGGPWPDRIGPVADGSVAAIGIHLLTTYSLAFEVISLVLLVAIIGALVVARAGRRKS